MSALGRCCRKTFFEARVSNIDSRSESRRATLIQKTRHLDSIVARALLVAGFIDSIDPKRTGRLTQYLGVLERLCSGRRVFLSRRAPHFPRGTGVHRRDGEANDEVRPCG